MAKKSNVVPFKPRRPKPEPVFVDKVAARTDSASVCGKGHVFEAGTTCGRCS